MISFSSRMGDAAADDRLLLKANSLLPADIRVMRLAAAPSDFVARFSNVGKVRTRASHLCDRSEIHTRRDSCPSQN